MDEPPTANKQMQAASNPLAPRQTAYRRSTVAKAVIMIPPNSTIAFSPPILNKTPNNTSVSHSQANHGWPAFENENKSWVGTAWCARIYSPVRMCQPVSPSISSAFQPLAPHTNSQASRAIQKQSEKDGNRARLKGVDAIGACSVMDGDMCAGRNN